MLGASSGGPGHALQGPDVREPEPDRAEIHLLSPEQVGLSEAEADGQNRKLHVRVMNNNELLLPSPGSL